LIDYANSSRHPTAANLAKHFTQNVCFSNSICWLAILNNLTSLPVKLSKITLHVKKGLIASADAVCWYYLFICPTQA
jgi:hypothetical protein